MSVGFGASAFLISAIVIGFDPENLAVAGAAMVAIALAFGITAMLAPMRFAEASKPVVAVPILAVLLLYGLGADGQLSRADGAILLAGFVLSIVVLIFLSKRGLDIRASGEVAEMLEEAEGLGR